MSSVLRSVRKRKKVRKLGRVDIIRREEYAGLELDAKVELIRSLIPLGLMHVEELLDQEVTALAGERCRGTSPLVGDGCGKATSFSWSTMASARLQNSTKFATVNTPPLNRLRDEPSVDSVSIQIQSRWSERRLS